MPSRRRDRALERPPFGQGRQSPIRRCSRREDREPAKEHTLVVGQQVIAPPDGIAHGAQSVRHIPPFPIEQRKAVDQARLDRLRGEHLDSGGGELDRQWKAVEPDADVRHRRGRLRRDRKIRFDRLGALHEELGRLRAKQLVYRGMTIRKRHGGHWKFMLARDVKRLAAGNQHGEGRTVDQKVGEIGCDRHDLFEVVDHQQEVAAGKVGQQDRPWETARPVQPARALGPMPVTRAAVRGWLQGERTAHFHRRGRARSAAICSARRVLPTPTGTGERDQRHVFAQDQTAHRRSLPFAADQWRAWDRDPVFARRCVDGCHPAPVLTCARCVRYRYHRANWIDRQLIATIRRELPGLPGPVRSARGAGSCLRRISE